MKNSKTKFFNLGPKNDWKKVLNKKFKDKITKAFEKTLKELNYDDK